MAFRKKCIDYDEKIKRRVEARILRGQGHLEIGVVSPEISL